MPSIRYEPGAVSTILSTELNSLANNAGAMNATAYDNSLPGNCYFWGDFELFVSFGIAPVVNSLVELYVIPSLDGINYADGSGGATPIVSMAHYRGGFPLRSVTTAQRIILSSIVLPPQLFKILLINRAGQAFVASGNTLKFEPYREQLI